MQDRNRPDQPPDRQDQQKNKGMPQQQSQQKRDQQKGAGQEPDDLQGGTRDRDRESPSLVFPAEEGPPFRWPLFHARRGHVAAGFGGWTRSVAANAPALRLTVSALSAKNLFG